MFTNFNFQQILSAFIVLFAVIDIIGAIPIIIDLKDKGKDVNALKATLISFLLLLGFFYAGDILLRLFHVDIESFAVAGAFVIFLLSLEMILDIEIFKNQGPIKEATLIALVDLDGPWNAAGENIVSFKCQAGTVIQESPF